MRQQVMTASRLTPDGAPEWVAYTLEVPRVDPLAVAEAWGALSVYWEQPSGGLAVAGFGAVGVEQATRPGTAYEALERVCRPGRIGWLGEPDAPGLGGCWFGGMAFDVEREPGEEWLGFPVARWILPELLVWTRGERSYVTGVARSAGAPEDVARHLRAMLEPRVASLPGTRREPRPLDGTEAPLPLRENRATWDRLIAQACAAFQAGTLSKVVGARSIDLEAPRAFSPVEVLARLRDSFPGCTTFLLDGAAGARFLGATPETLCRVEGRRLETEALAGSVVPGQDAALLWRAKEQHEHGEVLDAIRRGLGPLSTELEVLPPTVLKLPNVHHLRTPIRARLREDAALPAVLEALHPTPAVGGTPREEALAFLREHEGLARGWYAGAVGWIGPGGADLKVALRSALVQGRHARVFVGAGLVAGSTAEDEWRETAAKANTMLQALHGAAREVEHPASLGETGQQAG